MGGWGSSSWGQDPWGIGAPAPAEVIATEGVVSAVDMLTQDMILIQFEDDMKNDLVLQSTSSYTITADDFGQAVTIKSVESGTDAKTNEVLLHVSPMTVGASYTVTVISVRVANGGFMSTTNNTGQVIGRITKADSAFSGTTRVYNTQPGSIYRSIILAITKEDDRIGGSRNDRLPSVDD